MRSPHALFQFCKLFCKSRQGRLRVAQHFSAGNKSRQNVGVPEGRLNEIEISKSGFEIRSVQSSLRDSLSFACLYTALKCWATLSRP